jgi:sirohydrochlorin cobaltochelatase
MMREQIAKKKAIIVVSFGTSYPVILRLDIESVENRIRAAFPDYEVRRAFTSRIVIKLLAERDGVHIDNEEQALERLAVEGYKEVYIQPLHIVPGIEYEKVRKLVNRYVHDPKMTFKKIGLGRPLLYSMGKENHPDDYGFAIKALAAQLPAADPASAVVLMGHGGRHPANAAYGVLQLKLEDAGLTNVFVYTAEGFPSLSRVIDKLKQKQIRKVILVPFMLVAGDHVANDMAGESEDSAEFQLLAAGFGVDVCFCGLGENRAIQDIYVVHLQEAINHPIYCHHIGEELELKIG